MDDRTKRQYRNEAFQLLGIAERLLNEAGLDLLAADVGNVRSMINAIAQAGLEAGRKDAARRLAGGA